MVGVTLTRDAEQRKADAVQKLAEGGDAWVATASASGEPCLVPLSFAFLDGRVVLVTARNNRTARNIAENGQARLGLGSTRDVVLLEGPAEILTLGQLGEDQAARYTAQTGWDPRPDESLVWIVFSPLRVHIWREVDELEDRTIMQDGRWLV
jgi:hypothetical protein